MHCKHGKRKQVRVTYSFLTEYFRSPMSKVEMHDVEITIDKEYAASQSRNTSLAVGSDKVHPPVLKACASQLAAPLCISFNKLFVTGPLPKVWLQFVVVPLFKSKSKYNHSNYRSVSLTSVCCKTMEMVMASELVMYRESKGLLLDRQFGFRKQRSTEDQMLLVYLLRCCYHGG